jgi:DNA-binding LacI/PurR family transcriptional regulator
MAPLSRYFYHDLLASMEREAAESGYDLLLMPHTSSSAAGYLRALRARHVVGLISLAPNIADARIRALGDAKVPAVYVDARIQGPFATYVTSDKIDGAWQATSHLLDLGHRTIAFVGAPREWINSEERRLGYQQALAQRGIAADQSLERLEGFEASDGYTAASALLAERRDFTAIVSVSDVVAIGVIRALYEQGLRVPEDVSVTGFDDVVLAGYTTPPLTTVHQDHVLLGRGAVARLRGLIEGTSAPLPLVAPTQLVIRQSTGPVRESDILRELPVWR